MQSFGDLFANNKLLAVAILLALVVAVVVVVVMLYRLLFGRRLSQSGAGRSRQPRLGVVDAFDLDRQRQLVIVRRDNVEHLVMIGGPNDVVIETAIVRSGAAGIPASTRDKEAGPQGIVIPTVAPTAPAQHGSAPTLQVSAPSPSPTPNPATAFPATPTPPARPVAGSAGPSPKPMQPDHTPETDTPQAIPRPAPMGPPVLRTLPPRQPLGSLLPPNGGPQPRATIPMAAEPRAPLPPIRSSAQPTRMANSPPVPVSPPEKPVEEMKPSDQEDPVERAAGDQESSAQTPKASALVADLKPTARESVPLPPRPRPENPKVEASPVRISPPPANPNRMPPPTARSGTSPPVRALDALESLEEEMAKLLGRPVPPADKS